MTSPRTHDEDPYKFLSDLCGEPFWNVTRVWSGNGPEFGACFERTALAWSPCVFLWLTGPIYAYILSRKPYTPTPWTPLGYAKLFFSLVQLIVSVVELVWAASTGVAKTPVYTITPSILLLTYCLHIYLIYLGRRRGEGNSTIIWFYWLLFGVCGIPQLYTSIMEMVKQTPTVPLVLVVTFLVQFGGGVVLFLLNSCSDVHPSAHPSRTSQNPSPRLSASVPSRIWHRWSGGLVWQGWRRALTAQDLWDLEPDDTCATLTQKWHSRTPKSDGGSAKAPPSHATTSPERPRQPSVAEGVWRVVWRPFLAVGAFYFSAEGIRLFTPQILRLIMKHISDASQPAWHGYVYAAALLVACTATSVLKNHYYHTTLFQAIRVRSAVITALYSKALRVGSGGGRDASVGSVVTLVSVDAECVGMLMWLWDFVLSPVVVLVALAQLWQELGVSVLVGLGVLGVCVPVSVVLANKMKDIQEAALDLQDMRMKTTSEVINGIKVLKLYAWEGAFAGKVQDIRKNEVALLNKLALFKAVNAFLFYITPYMVALSTFATYLLAFPGNTLDAEKAFVSIALFNIMRIPISHVSMMMPHLIQAAVSLKRVQKFMSAEELDTTAICSNHNEDAAVVVSKGHFSWEDEDGHCTWSLKDIEMEVGHGKLVAIVGPVGSGKSSLINALLGEMKKNNGKVVINGNVAYVAQQAWLQNASLRDNITWGETFDKLHYKETVRACALQPDLDILPGGDLTEIGEKGINLSGGQKQRIALARAVYSDADIVLLDDPLSAVDSHVGQHIFEHVIGPKGILKNRTRILVTHSLHFLPQMDEVLVMESGCIVKYGTYEDLLVSQVDFTKLQHNTVNDEEPFIAGQDELTLLEEVEATEPLINRQTQRASTANTTAKCYRTRANESRRQSICEPTDYDSDTGISKHEHSSVLSNLNRKSWANLQCSMSQLSLISTGLPVIESGREEMYEEDEKGHHGLVENEAVETGRVSWQVYFLYGQSMGIIFAIVSILAVALGQASITGGDVWLSKWSSTPDACLGNTTCSNFNATCTISSDVSFEEMCKTAVSREAFLVGYGMFGVSQAFFLFLGMLTMMLGCLRSSRVLHQHLLNSIVRLPMSFFDTNPNGRVINRFSKDISVLDKLLPDSGREFLSCFMQVAATVIVIISAIPIAAVFVVPIMLVYYWVKVLYVASSRQLKRIDAVSKSPIYSHFGETLQGTTTIRAFRKEEQFYQESMKRIELNLKAGCSSLVVDRWAALSLEMLGTLITFLAAVLGVASRGYISAGIVGLCITYSLSVTFLFNWMVRMAAEVEANIVSVERIAEYCDTEREAELIQPNTSSEWPMDGQITFNGYQTRYRPGLDLVLKGLTCSIKPAEKIGIVGRTGAGKSSLTVALFRLIEASGGSIEIDGVNIAEVGLHDLRSRISIIPQDPVLFSGTLRLNLDPLDNHSDEEIWQVLELAHLSAYVSAQPLRLQQPVDEDGTNFSVGQRQLVCLARALLRKSRILVLDEATAAVDQDTDRLVQATIRSQFDQCTVLTIAHRLHTIMDSDRVLVMDQGHIAELDIPQVLLADHNSIFYGMAKDAGLV